MSVVYGEKKRLKRLMEDIVRYKDKIKDKMINVIFKNLETDIYYLIKKSDIYLENNLEVGAKNNLLIRRNIYFNYKVYYSIKFSTSSIDGNYNTTSDINNVILIKY